MKEYNSLITFAKRHYRTLMPFLTITKAINLGISLIELKTKRVKCMSKPSVFRIDPCSLCNLKCPPCNTHTAKTEEKRIMDYADFLVILDRLKKYALRFSLYDMGEPLMHKDIYKIIKATTKEKISTLISTNFNLFKKENLEDLFDSGLTVLSPCLDGFTQEKYETYRKGGNVDTVKDGIKMVMEYKHEHKCKFPYVDVQVVEFDHIKDELPDIKKFLEDTKVDKATYRVENLGFNSEESTMKVVTSNQSCFWLYVGMMIRPDGSVYPCCGRDFDRFSYGNILTESLEDIWNNKYYQFSRSLYSKGEDLVCSEDMKEIPCITCDLFKKDRKLSKG